MNRHTKPTGLICLLLIASLSAVWGQKAPAKPDLGPDLFLAVGKNDLNGVKTLLKQGADPNARNFLSFTPLLWAALSGHEEVARTLLAGGADLEAKTPFGTALTFALEGNQTGMIRFLLGRNANAAAARMDGITTLMLAAKNGDVSIVRQLLSKKLDINAHNTDGATALMYAARAGQTAAARLLLSAGANLQLADSRNWTALTYAIANGRSDLVSLLIQKGAEINKKDSIGRTPLMIAALYGRKPDIINELMTHGADPHAKDSQGRTALQMAMGRGSKECAQALRGTEATLSAEEPSVPMLAPGAAVTRSLSLLERTNTTFAKKGGCVSCHHEGLGLMATAALQERGFAIDTAQTQETMKRVYAQQTAMYPLVKQAINSPAAARRIPSAEIRELTPGLGFILSGLAAHHWPADEKVAVLAQALALQQESDGSWQFILPRVPVQSSYFTMTALAVRVLQTYGPKEKMAETAERIAHARKWLLHTPAPNTEDRTFRLLGLQWAGASLEERHQAIEELRALQRADGGWGQLPSLRSDAYATGQALYALHVAGALPTTDPAWQKGVRFLLQTQDEDGSWYVNKEAVPANNYLDVGFPHGESQYVSYAATCWATMALAQSEGAAQSVASRGTR